MRSGVPGRGGKGGLCLLPAVQQAVLWVVSAWAESAHRGRNGAAYEDWLPLRRSFWRGCLASFFVSRGQHSDAMKGRFGAHSCTEECRSGWVMGVRGTGNAVILGGESCG